MTNPSTRTNLVLLAYVLWCVLLLAFAPDAYNAKLPISVAFSAISSFPAAASFCIDMMWASFPIVVVALAFLGPVGSGRSDKFNPAISFVMLAVFVTPLALYVGIFSNSLDTDSHTAVARMIARAATSKIWFVFLCSFYACICAGLAWVSYVMYPRFLLRMHRAEV